MSHAARTGGVGDVVVPGGVVLTPAGLAVAASIGAATVPVVARPRVGVLTTGDEIVRSINARTNAIA